jgi:selenocysteine lyase/cysteine desulfurase
VSDTPLPRQLFPITERYHYFNHAGVSPLPRPAAEAIAEDAARLAAWGSLCHDRRAERMEQARRRAAELMGVAPEDVAVVKNTTEGLGFVANGLTWREGDRVVVPDREFPSAFYPWLLLRDQGVVVDLVEPVGEGLTVPLERFEEKLRTGAGRVRVVAVSWVQFGRGWRTDLAALARLCRDHGALLCADVIQGLGVVPADLGRWGVDFAMADGHKWLLGPEGFGVLYVGARHRDTLRVLEPGWASVAHREEWDNLDLVLDDSARRFEGGSYNITGAVGLAASLDLLADAGVDAIWSHVDRLCDRLASGAAELGAEVLSDRTGEGRSSILSLRLPGVDPAEAVEQLRRAGVVGAARAGGIRLAPHGYNDDADVDAALEALRAISS